MGISRRAWRRRDRKIKTEEGDASWTVNYEAGPVAARRKAVASRPQEPRPSTSTTATAAVHAHTTWRRRTRNHRERKVRVPDDIKETTVSVEEQRD